MKIPSLTSVKPTDRKIKKARQAAKELAKIILPKNTSVEKNIKTPADSFAYINKLIPTLTNGLKK